MWVASSTSESYYLFFNILLLNISDVHSSNDKVEGSKLSSAFDITCEAWRVSFFLDLKYLKLIKY